jgi:hypothetical protein
MEIKIPITAWWLDCTYYFIFLYAEGWGDQKENMAQNQATFGLIEKKQSIRFNTIAACPF